MSCCLREYSYYEAHAADVSLDDIISPNKPAEDIISSKQTLQRLRDGNLDSITVRGITVGQRYGYEFNDDTYFAFSEGDDLGWLGYFIGRSESLQKLIIENWSEDVIHALSDGIARNRSIKNISISELSSDRFAAVARTLMNLTQLEELDVFTNIGDAGITFLGSGGLGSIGSSLRGLHLRYGSIGSEGLSTLAVALAECTSIKKLDLRYNDFSMATDGLRALSGWLQTAGIRLDELGLGGCKINDEGLNALTMHHCKSPDHLSTLEVLDLSFNNFGNDGLLTLAAALAEGTSIKKLDLHCNDFSMAAEGLRSLSDTLQRAGIQLDELQLCGCCINDGGLNALREGAMNHCVSPDHLSTLEVLNLSENEFGNEGLSALAGALAGCISIKKLDLHCNDFSMAAEGLRSLSDTLQRAGIQLDELQLWDCHINDEGLNALIKGTMHYYKPPEHLSTLEVLDFSGNNFGNEGLLTLAAALAGCASIKKLDLDGNDFFMAEGLRALSGWLQTAGVQLDELHLRNCHINDEGLQALIEGAVNHCKYVDLESNGITASGFRLLSTSLQAESCGMEKLNIGNMSIGGDTAELFAHALVGNRTLRRLYLVGEEQADISITPAAWSAFSEALCDTSSVNNTYLSNHNFSEFWRDFYGEDMEEHGVIPRNLALYLRLNQRYPQHAATCKILMSHAHLDMAPLLKWELKFLPLAVNWFEKAKPCTALSFRENPILEESDEVFQSRVLTALYEFVREYPKKVLERRGEMTLVAAYDDKIALVELEKKRLSDEVEKRGSEIDQRDKEIDRLQKENMRLRGIVESVKKTINYY